MTATHVLTSFALHPTFSLIWLVDWCESCLFISSAAKRQRRLSSFNFSSLIDDERQVQVQSLTTRPQTRKREKNAYCHHLVLQDMEMRLPPSSPDAARKVWSQLDNANSRRHTTYALSASEIELSVAVLLLLKPGIREMKSAVRWSGKERWKCEASQEKKKDKSNLCRSAVF